MDPPSPEQMLKMKIGGFQQQLGKIMSLMPEDDKPDIQPFVDYFTNVVTPGTPNFVREYKGRKECTFFNLENLEWAYHNWTPRKGDVLLAVYPKTGTTWMMNIVRQLMYLKDPEMMKVAQLIDNPLFAYLEFGNRTKYEILERLPLKPRMLVTHMMPDVINLKKFEDAGVKVIQCYRNPKDSIVSFFYHMLAVTGEHRRAQYPEYFTDDFNVFFDRLTAGEAPTGYKPGEWYPHYLKQWDDYKKQHENMFHRVAFEDLKKDANSRIKEIASFLGISITDEEASQVVENTTFKSLKSKNDGSRPGNFFRKGEIGDFKNHLTSEQEARVEESMKAVLKDTDIKFDYN